MTVLQSGLYTVSDVSEPSELPDMSDVLLTSTDFIVEDVEESGPKSNEMSRRLNAFSGLFGAFVRKSGFTRSIGFCADFDRGDGILIDFKTFWVFLPVISK